ARPIWPAPHHGLDHWARDVPTAAGHGRPAVGNHLSWRIMSERQGEAEHELMALLRTGDRVTLARAITLVESSRASDRPAAHALVRAATKEGKPSVRIGITGIPGVGKSTLIDALGSQLIKDGHRV